VVPGALFAKSAQLLGDVGGPDAVPALLAKLAYRDPDPGVELYVRVLAAESLGRMRAAAAARPLAERVVGEGDADVRDRFCDALVRIGDPAALPALKAAASGASDWDLREGPLTAVSRLGAPGDRAFIAAARAKDCPAGCAPAVDAAYRAMDARLEAAGCGDAACWAAKLSDPAAAVRDRAALELGRAGGAPHVQALADAIVRPVGDEAALAARYHAILALGWIARREPIGAAGEAIAARIEQMIAADRGRTLTAAVNEDGLRLATRLRRGAR
jgi:HEAT repeat protein